MVSRGLAWLLGLRGLWDLAASWPRDLRGGHIMPQAPRFLAGVRATHPHIPTSPSPQTQRMSKGCPLPTAWEGLGRRG